MRSESGSTTPGSERQQITQLAAAAGGHATNEQAASTPHVRTRASPHRGRTRWRLEWPMQWGHQGPRRSAGRAPKHQPMAMYAVMRCHGARYGLGEWCSACRSTCVTPHVGPRHARRATRVRTRTTCHKIQQISVIRNRRNPRPDADVWLRSVLSTLRHLPLSGGQNHPLLPAKHVLF